MPSLTKDVFAKSSPAGLKGINAMPHSNMEDDFNESGNRLLSPGQAVAMHCHHYNINLQKTLEDTLGPSGHALMYRSAEEAIYHDFQLLLERHQERQTVASKLDLAAALYLHCGLGILRFEDITPSTGRIISPAGHHVTGWLAKHGRRETPGCHFSRGWMAGILEVVFNLPLGSIQVTETVCKMMRANNCIFHVTPGQTTE